jgi:thiol:disulfide interchange protein
MEERTFLDPDVVAAGRGVAFLRVDMTAPDDFTERVMRSFRVHAAPTTIFFDSKGKEWHRRGGFIGPEEFAQLLREVGDDKNPNPRTQGELKPI